jgi:hypothetical protein
MTSRFLIDRGTATFSATLVARVPDRWRLLASGSFPSSVDREAVLAFVDGRANGGEPGVAGNGHLDAWRDRERIEAVSIPPRRVALVSSNARRTPDLETAAERAGWNIRAVVSADRADALASARALAELQLDAVVIASGDPPGREERGALGELVSLAVAALERLPELTIVLVGAAAEHEGRFPHERVVLAPAPSTGRGAADGSELTSALMGIAEEPHGARLAMARSVASLASMLERTVELVEVGASGGAWFRAAPDAETAGPEDDSVDAPSTAASGSADVDGIEGFVTAAGALVPETIDDDDEVDLDAVIGWSPLRLDRPTHRDRLRDLRAHPWQDATGEGTLLRVAAVHAAMERIEQQRVAFGGVPSEQMRPPDLLVVSGGAFAVAPAPAVALAVADTIRRPGMTQVAYDHARALAPLGTLGEAERREMLADLADDLLLPLGSLLVLTGGRQGRDLGRLTVTSDWATHDPQPLSSGALRVVELPPGAPASVELEVREGRFGRTRARRVGFEATGGLGGLFIDTRGVPLRLPPRTERRREVVAQWQRSLWPGAE